jgi:tetratricopeptide (TPR) repeat protein
MWRSVLLSLCLLVSILSHVLCSQQMWQMRGNVRRETRAGYVLPSRFSSVLAFGYKGLLADFLFLKSITFFGERHMVQKALSEDDWEYLIANLEVVTDLDPYFSDPYVFAEANLAWEGKIKETNRLLEKGAHFRSWDWRIPYYLGFNHFYFLQDFEKAAEYIMKAARHPNSHAFLSTLGARLAYYGGKSRTAVLFLKEMIVETNDPGLRNRLEIRLLALERAAEVEELVEHFKSDHGHAPGKMTDLVAAGYIDDLPEDPYGGQWILLKSGRVFSTSKFTKARK